MAVLGLYNLVVEHDVGAAGRAGTEVLLTKLVSLGLERSTDLQEEVSISSQRHPLIDANDK